MIRENERHIVAAILGCGAIARLFWSLSAGNLKPLMTESHYVAVSLATSGRFANPFGVETGPTAHIGLLTPLPSAIAYWLFGQTAKAELALILWAIAVVTFGFWLCWRLFCALNVAPVARVSALAFVALVPIQYGLETVEGRSWEVNLAVAVLLLILVRLTNRETLRSSQNLAVTGAIAGALFIISPPAGLAAAFAIAASHFVNRDMAQSWISASFFGIAVALIGSPWVARNEAYLHSPVLLRDNLPIELALSNYPGALHPLDERLAYVSRMKEIHPLGFSHAIDKLRASGGEVSYYNKLSRETSNWIKRNPTQFLYLSGRRLVQYYFPPQWFWGMFGGAGKAVWVRQLLVWGFTFTGGLTLIFMTKRDGRYAIILATVLSCCAIYIFVQPTLRYHYLISTILVFACFDGLYRSLQWTLALWRSSDGQPSFAK